MKEEEEKKYEERLEANRTPYNEKYEKWLREKKLLKANQMAFKKEIGNENLSLDELKVLLKKHKICCFFGQIFRFSKGAISFEQLMEGSYLIK